MVLRKFKSILNKIIPENYPQEISIDDYTTVPVRFRVYNGVQKYRVKQYGGEFEYTGEILSRLTENDILYDIGACVGLIALTAASNGVQVIAFEPDPGFRENLKENKKINNLDFNIFPLAISDKQGQTVLYSDGIGGNSPSLRKTGDRQEITVDTNSIDNLAGDTINFPTAMKMDIEGAEILALRGMQEILNSSNSPKYIFLETHPKFLKLFDADEQEVIDIITDAGYKIDYQKERADQTHWIFKK